MFIVFSFGISVAQCLNMMNLIKNAALILMYFVVVCFGLYSTYLTFREAWADWFGHSTLVVVGLVVIAIIAGLLNQGRTSRKTYRGQLHESLGDGPDKAP